MNKKLGFVVVALIAVAAGWYAFRPERLFLNQTVNESLEGAANAAVTSATEPRVLLQGQFHKGSHETKGLATIYELPNGTRTLRLTDFETSNGPDVQVYLVAANDAKDNETVTKAGFVRVDALKGNIGDQNYTLPADVDLSKYRAVTIWCRRFGVNFGTAPLAEAMDAMSSDAMSADVMSAPSVTMTEAMPSGAPQLLATGMFHGVSHPTTGTASIYEVGGRRVLRFTNFETSNGPDVQVYLVAASDATDNATVTTAGFVPVAALKGNIGDQNYDLPADVDLGKYRAVTIWCRRFGVNFATAPLTTENS